MSTALSRARTEIGAKLVLGSIWRRHHVSILVLSPLLIGLVLLAIWHSITVAIPAGHVGVKWSRFSGGTDTDTVYLEGNHFLYPWDKMSIYDERLQQFNRDYDVLTRDGMMMSVNIAVRYRLNHSAVGLLHKHVGPDYVDSLLAPAVGSFARIIFSQNTADDIYTDRRVAIQTEIKQAIEPELVRSLSQDGRQRVPWFFLDDILVRSMRFPPQVETAINQKMAALQLREEYKYRLQREELESKRKQIEAEGIARFQSIVDAGISETYLRWKGIDATLALAQSPNAKIVIIGASKDGLPLILGGLDQSPPTKQGRDMRAGEKSGSLEMVGESRPAAEALVRAIGPAKGAENDRLEIAPNAARTAGSESANQ
jgi:regulator of protease activity HflC (stomatin/prohibitin superfamily)